MTSEHELVLTLRHSRKKLIYPLFLTQIIGIGLLWVIYAFFNDMIKPSRVMFAYIAIPWGACSYFALISMFIPKLFNPHFMSVFADGSVVYRPLFRTFHLKFSPNFRWTINGSKIEFTDVGSQSRCVELPRTVIM
jgi:hypothetical protein